jgi:hypothetical protein
MAVLMVADSALKPTTAAKRVVKGIGDTHLRRLQVKWKMFGQELLAAAAEKRAAELRRAKERRISQASQDMPIPRASASMFQNWPIIDPSLAETLRTFTELPGIKAMRELQESLQASPLMKLMETLRESPLTKMLQEIRQPAWLESFRCIDRQNQELRRLCGGGWPTD